MKKIITTAVSILFISLFLNSCASKKQHCDAYGNLISVSTEDSSFENISVDQSKNDKVN